MSCEECFDEQAYLYNRVMSLERLCGELNATLLQCQLSNSLCRCEAADPRRFKTYVYDHENGRALVTHVQDLRRCDTGERAGIVSPDGSWIHNEPAPATVESVLAALANVEPSVELEELELESDSSGEEEEDEQSEPTPDHLYSAPPPSDEDRQAFLDSAKALHMVERLHRMSTGDAETAKCLGVPLQVIII